MNGHGREEDNEASGLAARISATSKRAAETVAGIATNDALLHPSLAGRDEELVRIQRKARGLGHDIVGFSHSHPDHPARWSPTDLAEAHWTGCSYVITAVAQGKAAITNSFLLTGTGEEDKRFEDEPIEILVGEPELTTRN